MSGRLSRVGQIYLRHFNGHRRERLFLSSVAFLITFGIVRGITHAIKANLGPFHNVAVGATHIHHLVPGILLLLGVGYLWLVEIGSGIEGTSAWTSRLTAILYGIGAALTLDEFALWLNLKDVYWAAQGRDSIDAVVIFFAVLSVGWWGKPFFQEVIRELRRPFD